MHIRAPKEEPEKGGFPLIVPAGHVAITPPGQVWMTVDASGTISANTLYTLTGNEVGLGEWGIRFEGGKGFRIQICQQGQTPASSSADVADITSDPRFMAIMALPSGDRGRTFKDSASSGRQEEVDKFPLDGPRVFGKCVDYCVMNDRTLVQQIIHWKNTVCKLPDGHPGAETAMAAALTIQDMMTWDQLDCRNLLGPEHLMRTICLEEYKEKRRAEVERAQQAKKAGAGSATQLEVDIFKGTRHSRQQYMLPVEFAQWLAKELGVEADHQKSVLKYNQYLLGKLSS